MECAPILLIAVIVLYLLYWLKKNYDFRQIIDKYPGKPYNYIVGDILNISRSRDIMFLQAREWSKEFPDGYKLWLGFFASFNFNTAQDTEFILSSSKYIEKSKMYSFLHPWLQTGLLTSGGQKWHQRRKLLTPAFHFNILKQFVRIFGDHGKRFVKQLEDECNQPKTDIEPLISAVTLNIICETAMGISLNLDDDAQVRYRQAIHGLIPIMLKQLISPWLYNSFLYNLTPEGRQANKYIKVLHEFTTSVIRERERTFTDDILVDIENDNDEDGIYKKKRFAMLDLLISAKLNNGAIDDAGIREEVDTFMFRGHDTTSSGLCFSLLMLANHKEIQERVRAEVDSIFLKSDRAASYQDLQNMSYLDMVIKETLRLYPSVPFISRAMEETSTFRNGKYTVPGGTYVNVHIYDLHRDPRVFSDPEKFDPDRFLPENVKGRHPYSYVPFSAGPRNCIGCVSHFEQIYYYVYVIRFLGQRFAMLEMKSVISSVLRYYELDPIDSPVDVKMVVDLVLRPINGIHIKIKTRL